MYGPSPLQIEDGERIDNCRLLEAAAEGPDGL
jgi:hypothetical protein